MAIRTFLSDRGDTGRRVDLVLRRHLANLECATRTRVQAWIDEGTVSINGQTVRRAATRVAGGDVLAVDVPDDAAPALRSIEAQSLPLQIVFEDDYLILVNKPPGVVVHPTHAHPDGTLLNALAWHARDTTSSIVGRLDKLTSGLVLAAKSPRLHAQLQKTMASAATEKHYLALVYGRIKDKRGKIDLRLRRDPKDRRRVVASTTAGARSVTEFERLAQLTAPRPGIALLRCRLLTGRTHQIRAHLAARGWPIVGDPVYGEPRAPNVADAQLARALREFSRQALHAWRLAFIHPITKARVVVEAPLPDDMRALLGAASLGGPALRTDGGV